MALTKVTEKVITDNLSISGIASASNFKTGSTNVHNVGVEAAGVNVLGGDTPIGSGSTIYDDGGARFSGVVTATSFVGSGANLTGIDATSIKHTDGSVKVQAINTGANLTGNLSVSGNLGIAGVLTYEDVTNVDSIGIITARSTVSIADSIVHLGDTNTSLRFPAADTITAETSGLERLRIDSNGRVLIGTTNNTSLGSIDQNVVIGSTTNAEEVALTLNVMEGTNNRRAKFFLDDDDGVFGIDATASTGVPDFVIRSATSEKLRINQNGKVIIGNDGTNFGNAAVQAFIQHGNTAGESGFSSVDTTSVAAGVGGEIAFHGKYNTGAQDYAYLGHVRGIKENATAGNTACALTFHTRPNATAPQERVRITSTGVLETYGGSGGAAVKIKSGGDLEIYHANNSDKVTIFCDNNNQLTVSEKLRFANTSGGILRSNGQYALKPTGACVQTKVTYRGTKFTNSSSTYQVVHSHDFNGIESGNLIGMHLDCDMNADTGGSSWQMMGLRIGSTMYSEKIIEHSGGMNMNASANGLTGAMSAGNHAVQFVTRNGGGTCSYNEGNTASGIVLHTYEYVS